jgi:error-prone DNA polymerase
MFGFVHLHCRSYFSLKDGAFSPEDLAVRAAELGMPAVALTDRDGLYGAVRFTDACHRLGIKPILGAWVTVNGGGPTRRRGSSSAGERERGSSKRGGDGSPERPRRASDPPPRHVLLLARDAVGYGNLCRLLTGAHMRGERGEPSVTPSEVMARAEGLTVLLGPESPPGALALQGRLGAARELLRPWREAFGAWCFVEVRHLLEPGSTATVRSLLRLADDAEVPAVATNAVRHLTREDGFLADALECMREIVPVAEHHVTRRNGEGHLKPPAEMRALFADRPDLCDATGRIAEACTFDLGLGTVHFPDFPTPAGRSATSVLAERCHGGITWRGMVHDRRVLDRLDDELSQIHRMGYAAYFLTVADIVAEVKRMGIRCGARGSAAGSLVCYLTGISEVDPVHHGLLFERFINPLRDELPDIDVDVESARREEVYEMVLRRHGDDRCACVTMVDTYRARAAVREVGKALGYPEDEIDRVAKAFPHIGAHRIRDALDTLPELRGSNLGAGQLELLFRVAERLNGFPRHLALHPSGIVLSGDDLPDRIPLERSFLDHRMVQADKDDVERLGLLKLDVLGVRLLSSMRHALDEIRRTTGERIDLDRIPHDDPATFDLIRASDTIGCFQIESPGQRELLQKLQPERFEDLIVDISLFRPGPVKSDMITPYINRRHGWERPRYAHPALRPALQETYGVIVYHEQIMRVLEVAGYDLAQADRIRRHLDDGAEIGELQNAFLEHAVACGLGSADADTVWRELASFASFGFCKAHAAAFAVPTYQSSWLKAHYPAHFLAGVLTHEPGMYPRRLILEDAREHGIPILPLDVNHSVRDHRVEPVALQVGEVAPRRRSASPARSLSEGDARVSPSPRDPSRAAAPRARSQRLGSAIEPPLRTSPTSPSPSDRASSPERPGARGPTRAGAAFGIRIGLRDVHGMGDAEIASILVARAERPFDSVGDFLRRTHVSRPVVEALAHAGAFDGLPSGTRRDRLYQAMTTEMQREGEQLALPLGGAERAPGLREYTDGERVRAELEVVGMDVSRHLLSFYEPLLEDLGVTRSGDLRRRRGDTHVMVAGVKVSSQTPAVRSGQRIIFLTLDDATGPIEITVFERVQERCAHTVFHGFLLAVWGRLRRTGVGGVSIAADEVWDLQVLDAARRRGCLLEMMRTSSGTLDPIAPRKIWHSSGGSSGW